MSNQNPPAKKEPLPSLRITPPPTAVKPKPSNPIEALCKSFCCCCQASKSQDLLTQKPPRPSAALDLYLRDYQRDQARQEAMESSRMVVEARREWEEVQRARSAVMRQMACLEEQVGRLEADREDLVKQREGRRVRLVIPKEDEERQKTKEILEEVAMRRARLKEENHEKGTEGLQKKNAVIVDHDRYFVDRGFVKDTNSKAVVDVKTDKEVFGNLVQDRKSRKPQKTVKTQPVPEAKEGRQNWFKVRVICSHEDFFAEDGKYRAQLEELREQQRRAEEEEKRLKELEDEKSGVYAELYKQALAELTVQHAERERALAERRAQESDERLESPGGHELRTGVNTCKVTARPGWDLVGGRCSICGRLVSEAKTRSMFTRTRIKRQPDVADREVTRDDDKCRRRMESEETFGCQGALRVEVLRQIQMSIARLDEEERRQVGEMERIGLECEATGDDVSDEIGASDLGAGHLGSAVHVGELKSFVRKSLGDELEEMLAAIKEKIRGLDDSIRNDVRERVGVREGGNGNECSPSDAVVMRVPSPRNDQRPLRRCRSELGLNRRASKLLQGGDSCGAKSVKVKMAEAMKEYSGAVRDELRRIEDGSSGSGSSDALGEIKNSKSCQTVGLVGGKGVLEMQSQLVNKDEIRECMKEVFRECSLNRSGGQAGCEQEFQKKLEDILDQQYRLKLHIEECFLKSDIENLRKIANEKKEMEEKRLKLVKSPIKIVVLENENNLIDLDSEKIKSDTTTGCEKCKQPHDQHHVSSSSISKLSELRVCKTFVKKMPRARFNCRLNKRFLNERAGNIFAKRKVQKACTTDNGVMTDESEIMSEVANPSEAELDLETFRKDNQADILALEKISEQQDFYYYGPNYRAAVSDLMNLHSRLDSEINVRCSGSNDSCSSLHDEDNITVICNNVSQSCNIRDSKTEQAPERKEMENLCIDQPITGSTPCENSDELKVADEEEHQVIDLEENSENELKQLLMPIAIEQQVFTEDDNSDSCCEYEPENGLTTMSLKPIHLVISEADRLRGPTLRNILNVDTDEDVVNFLCGDANCTNKFKSPYVGYPEPRENVVSNWNRLSNFMVNYANESGIADEVRRSWLYDERASEILPPGSPAGSAVTSVQVWTPAEEVIFLDFLGDHTPSPEVWDKAAVRIPSKSRHQCIRRFAEKMLLLEDMKMKAFRNEQMGFSNLTILLDGIILKKISSLLY